MKYVTYFLLPILFAAAGAYNIPQDDGFTNNLSKFRNDFPQEKIYVQTDRAQYFAGETIWMKAWCTLDGGPSYLSRIIYITVSNTSGQVISKKMYKLDSLGTTAANIDIPTATTSGNYTVSAYSLWMLNFPEFIYKKDIFIYNRDYKEQKAKTAPSLAASFFPEGGDLVAGVRNRVAFKVSDNAGFPVEARGYITDNTGKKIVEFASEHSGMGSFELEPMAGMDYTANIPFGNGGTLQFKLPKPREEGIILRVENNNPNRIFILLSRAEKNKQQYNKLKLFAQMHYQKVFSADIDFEAGQTATSISKKNLPAGILQVTVFNKQNEPLAERIVFVENYEVEKPAIKLDTINLQSKAKNNLSFSLQNTTPASLSVLVKDAAFDKEVYKDETIASSLLATSDLKGYIHQPGYYFKDKEATTLHHLDLLLMTQGWRRFEWKKILNNNFPVLTYPVESAISIAGKVTKSDRTALVKDGKVSFIIKGEDSTSILADASLTDKGEFLLSDVNFRKRAKISYQGTNNKKENLVVDVKLTPSHIDSLTRLNVLPATNMDTLSISTQSNALAGYMFSKSRSADTSFKGINYLGNVVVQTKRRSPEDSLNNEYANGAFQMGKAIVPGDYKTYRTVWQMLLAAVPGIRIEGNPFDPEVYFTRFQGLNNVFTPAPGADEGLNEFGNMESNGITYFLNEVNVSKDVINTLAKDDIALIKVYKNEGAALGAREGAIAFYTKKGMPVRTDPSAKSFNTITREGYALIREFYSPDYENYPPAASETDKRVTLYWNPKPKPAKDGSYHIRFFNNDSGKKFKLIIQGLDKEGRIIYTEKLVE